MKLIKLWPELWAVPLVLMAIILSPYFLRWMDPTAATYDAGVLQIYIFAALGLTLGNALVWLGIRLNFFGMYRFYARDFRLTFNNLSGGQKICALLALYSVLLFCFVLLVRVIG